MPTRIDLLCEGASKSASDPNDEDYTVFWLVLADQFEKRGVAHAPTREKAIAIIDRGDDLMMMERLGMKSADLCKRGAKLAELRSRLAAAPRHSKPRATIKAPQPFVLDIGVAGSSCLTPYLRDNYYADTRGFPMAGGSSSFSIAAFDHLV